MLETIDFDAEKITDSEYKTRYKDLISRLIVLQQQARSHNVGMVVLFEGWDGAGKGSRISDLVYNLDARATSVHVTKDVPDEELEDFICGDNGVTGYYPFMQQFWQSLGQRGHITFYDRGWYTTAMEYLLKARKAAEKREKPLYGGFGGSKTVVDFARSVESFEQQLIDDGYIVIKLFMHVSKKAQRKRLERLRDNPDTKWRVSKEKWKRTKSYDDIYPLFDALLERSDFGFCPWKVVNGEDKNRANITVVETMVEGLEKALADKEAQRDGTSIAAKEAAQREAEAQEAIALGLEQELAEIAETSGKEDAEQIRESVDMNEMVARTWEEVRKTFLAESHMHVVGAPKTSRFKTVPNPPTVDEIDSTLVLSRSDYKKQLKQEQERLGKLQPKLFQKRIPLIIMYEGWDAAGKGGNIKRIAQALDARSYTIFPSASPTEAELLHPHLWRYWTRLPKAGHVGIYDRTWYGRVLVERVEGYADVHQWSRAYDEINEFERDLELWGAIIAKFWVNVSPDEQLHRFHERQENIEKQWKITDEDWRNREKYPEYKVAVDDMFRLTSTDYAPWIILESDDKLYARVKALRLVNNAIEKRLDEIDQA